MLGIDHQHEDGERLSLEQIRAFLEASEEFTICSQQTEGDLRLGEPRRWWSRNTAVNGASKGLVRQYLGKMTGLSRAQVTRLIGRYQQGGKCSSAAIGGTGSPAGTRGPTSNCWQRWTKRMKR